MEAAANIVPLKSVKKPRKSDVVREKKVQGVAHINHKGRLIADKQIGEDCK